MIYVNTDLDKNDPDKISENAQNSGSLLGILRSYMQPTNDGHSSDWLVDFDSDFTVPNIQENPSPYPEIKSVSCSENVILRFQRQAQARLLLPNNRVAGCFRYRIKKDVKVKKSLSTGKAHFADLMICGSVWDCPACSAKISERRRVELTQALNQHTAKGLSAPLVTFTYPHQWRDDLRSLVEAQQKAFIWMYMHNDFRYIKETFRFLGRVKALEINHGQENGWHPHIHEIWFLNVYVHAGCYDGLKFMLHELWVKACAYAGLGEPSFEHGVDIRGGEYAGKYITKYGEEPHSKKWGIEHEITRFDAKKGRMESRSPFQLLDDAIEGDLPAGLLFQEYSQVFKGKTRLKWSRGLKAMFEIKEFSDDEIAKETDDASILLATITANEWHVILRLSTPKNDHRGMIIKIANESVNGESLRAYIADLVANYVEVH